MAPEPIMNTLEFSNFFSKSSPIIVLSPWVLFDTSDRLLMNFYLSSLSSGKVSIIYENSAKKYCLIGVYLPVIALNASWATIPPKRAQIGPKVPEQV